MRKLKRVHKSLYILEAGFIYCQRRGIKYTDDKFVDEIFLTEDFVCEGEFDNICTDLRCYRYHKSYQLQEISEAEYEKCIDEFGEDKREMNEREMFEQSFKRPVNYFELSPGQQWDIDKNLEILDWEGTGLTEEDNQRFRNHYNRWKEKK